MPMTRVLKYAAGHRQVSESATTPTPITSMEFEQVLAQEIAALGVDGLPLQQGLTHSSYALEEGIRASVLSHHQQDERLQVRAGIFYQGMIAGCNCADDPTPVEPVPEYCEVELSIRLSDGEIEKCQLASE